jgi:cation:H+ antiporter
LDFHHAIVSLSTPLLGVLTVVALAVLVRSADVLVDAASVLAQRMGISPVIVGATIVSLGTTSPECAVSVLAAWTGRPGLALGNAVGSIIADTGLIFGVCSMLMPLPANRFVLSRQGWIQFGAAMMLGLVCYLSYWRLGESATLGRGIGLLFLALLVVYVALSIRWSGGPVHLEESADDARRSTGGLLGVLLASLAGVAVGSHILVEGAAEGALRFGVPEVVIAGTVVAFGTSLPELAVGISAVRKRQPDLLIGNVIGADILNVLFVIGASAVAAPLPLLDPSSAVPTLFLSVHLPSMLVLMLLFRACIALAVRRGAFPRWVGIPLVTVYVVYTAWQFGVGRV